MIATSSAPTLCEGTVYHRRLRPVHHSFSYRVFYLRIPLAKMGQLPNRWLSRDRFNLLSFMSRDYGPRDGTDFAAWVRARLCDAGLSPIEGDIVLQTFPRVLGYVFNPISLWFVHDHTQALRAVIAEVSNTFGERHNYVIAHPDGAPILGTDCLVAQKLLHVSPSAKSKDITVFASVRRTAIGRR